MNNTETTQALIDAIKDATALRAELFARGIVLPNGKFNTDTPSPNFRPTQQVGEYVLAAAEQTSTGHEIIITQHDIRSVQLAKAALYAGAKLLMAHRGVDRVHRVILAGAFGSYISKEHALLIGIFPDCDLENVYAVGNAAGGQEKTAREQNGHVRLAPNHQYPRRLL